ncbi:MAG: hypothetical protein WC556_07460 [Candidatus Methanoperedens sp.]
MCTPFAAPLSTVYGYCGKGARGVERAIPEAIAAPSAPKRPQ